ncbi:MAG: hypothetical protein ACR2PL_03035, partial [Dehalococcoidia bacterium]
MMGYRPGDERQTRRRYSGPADFLTPDGTHFIANCDARFSRERWQGIVTLQGFDRSLGRGDVCRITAEPFGE